MTKGVQGAGQLGGTSDAGYGLGRPGSFPKYTGNLMAQKVNTSPGVPSAPARSPSDAKVTTAGMPKGNMAKAPSPGH